MRALIGGRTVASWSSREDGDDVARTTVCDRVFKLNCLLEDNGTSLVSSRDAEASLSGISPFKNSGVVLAF
jgi:hypothetical protein